ncbi:unnamed protein product [Porites evermanni]|uniref:Uncharacterized protein n=1 Tax=Porites evermanni TaxID=104178 RepID=A0ABN8T1S1_9CNID|nr:unnamed protein product [Porites evermanni]
MTIITHYRRNRRDILKTQETLLHEDSSSEVAGDTNSRDPVANQLPNHLRDESDSELTSAISPIISRENCTQQGFNSGNNSGNSKYARARIGIVGHESRCGARNPFKSRIGFGASGNWYEMKNDNSCGNEYEDKESIVAFGYIFVQ